jgi:regulator of protease activity HflC (stomatin/prohibitin superfamily)
MPTPASIATASQELRRSAANGWLMLIVNLILLFGGIALLIRGLVISAEEHNFSMLILCGLLLEPLAIILLCGHFTLQPNEARVLILFGSYHGTVRKSGFFWANPFYARIRSRIPLAPTERDVPKRPTHGGSTTSFRSLGAKISLRARNFISDKLKVNDKRGNPVEIAAVIVWRVDGYGEGGLRRGRFRKLRTDPERGGDPSHRQPL